VVAVLSPMPTKRAPGAGAALRPRACRPAGPPVLRLVGPDERIRAVAAPPVHPVGLRRPSAAVVRRRRLAMLAGLLLALVGGWFALQAALGLFGGGPLATTGQPGGLRPAAARVWVVQPGDTIWTIARAVSGGRGDERPLVDRLSAEVGDRALQVGQRIPLP